MVGQVDGLGCFNRCSRASGWTSPPTLRSFRHCAHFPCVLPPCAHAAATTPVQQLAYSSLNFTPPYPRFPKGSSGQRAHRPFRGLLGIHSHCGLHTLFRPGPRCRPSSSPPTGMTRSRSPTSRPCRRMRRSVGAGSYGRCRQGGADAPDGHARPADPAFPRRAAGKVRRPPSWGRRLACTSRVAARSLPERSVRGTWSSCLRYGKIVSSCR